jgi:superfamily II DNA or RNA helicase
MATDKPILIEACPGAGKTRFALTAAAKLILAGQINRVLIVVPTSRLVTQWIEASNGAGGGPSLPVAPVGWKPIRPLYAPWAGGVITYHTLFRHTTMLAALAAEPGYRTLVVFDEVHHAGTDGAWGVAAQQAFLRSATKIVSLSGTPFRTKDPIVFVDTMNGRAKCDYSYRYDAALSDKTCRPVRFAAVGGSATFRTPSGTEHTVTFDDDLNERGESYRLRTVLEVQTSDGHLAAMLVEANSYLGNLRATADPDAGGLIVCMDCDHADATANLLAHQTGLRPTVVCSRTNNPDDPDPGPAIEAFIRSTSPWLVCVKMVSEGVDIRRLRVIVYATNVTAELAFRQIVGRVVRTDTANADDDHGYVVMPADPRLIELAERITGEAPVKVRQLLTVSERAASDSLERRSNGSFQPLASTGNLDLVFDHDGRQVEAALLDAANRYLRAQGSATISAFDLAHAAGADPELRERLLHYGLDE